MKKIIALLLILCPYSLLYSSSIEVSELGSGEINWDADTVLVTASLKIDSLSTLTIAPGTYVEFQGHYRLRVYGRLLAVGNENDSITFTVKDTLGFFNINNNEGGWHGIRFDSLTNKEADSSIIDYCILNYGKAVTSDDDLDYELKDEGHGPDVCQGGAIFIKYVSKVRVSNCRLSNNIMQNDATLYVQGAAPVIRHNNISNNIAYDDAGAIRCTNGASPIIENNIILNNRSYSQAAAIYLIDYCDPQIIGNTIQFNYTSGDAGGIMVSSNSDPVVMNNVVMYNTAEGNAGGVACWNRSNAKVVNNLICKNTAGLAGGGMRVTLGSPDINNNTICDNKAKTGGGITFNSTNPTFPCRSDCHNNIIYGNTADSVGDQIYLSGSTKPDFRFCDIEGGKEAFALDTNLSSYKGIYTYNIDEEPLFTNSGTHPYLIATGSPCIEAGTNDTFELFLPEYDLRGAARIYDGNNDGLALIDIGCYEYHPDLSVEEPMNTISNAVCVPNPVKEKAVIEYTLARAGFVNIKIYDIPGNEVMEIENEYMQPGIHQAVFNTENLHSGAYYYVIGVGQGSYSGKMIKE